MTGAESIALARLALRSGEGRRLDLDLVVGGLDLGGQSYSVEPKPVPARLDVSRTASGHALRLAFAATVDGPCMRCLGPAAVTVEVEAREVDQRGAADEELRSPYVDEEVLDVAAWAHDALALALPPQLLCRDDCAGLCPVCGESLNDAEPGAHDHPSEPDPRLAKLSELLDREQ
jgi:uncharacterized protein